MAKPLRIGVLGCGFMGRAHSNAWGQVNHFFPREHQPVLKACYGREADREKLEDFAAKWGYESIETDWRKVVGRDDIDLVDVCVPNFMHHDCVIAAAEAGKIIVCEKPLAMSVAEAEEMVAAVDAAGVANMVSFNYRRVPAIALFKQIIEEGRVGRPFHYRATYNQDYTIGADVPQGGMALWRLDSRVAGSGEHADTGKVEKVDIDDACMFLAVFENGSMGTFESTRYARGRKNYSTMEINGENGAIFFDLEDPHILQYFRYADPATGKKIEDHLTGWQRIHVTNFEHPYMKSWWVPGCTIGYEHTFINSFADFLASLEGGEPFQPDMKTALRTQKVCESVLESAKEGRWVETL